MFVVDDVVLVATVVQTTGVADKLLVLYHVYEIIFPFTPGLALTVKSVVAAFKQAV